MKIQVGVPSPPPTVPFSSLCIGEVFRFADWANREEGYFMVIRIDPIHPHFDCVRLDAPGGQMASGTPHRLCIRVNAVLVVNP